MHAAGSERRTMDGVAGKHLGTETLSSRAGHAACVIALVGVQFVLRHAPSSPSGDEVTTHEAPRGI